MFAKYFAALALAAAAVLGQQINTPASVTVCQPTLLSWSGGSAPYFLSVIPGGQASATALKDFGQQTGTSYTWTVDIPAGTSITLKLTDSTGNTVYSSPISIGEGTSTSCLTASSGASSSAASSTGAVAGASSAVSSAIASASSAASSAVSSASSAAASGASSAASRASSASSSPASAASSARSSAASGASSAASGASSAAASATSAVSGADKLVVTGLGAALLAAVGVVMA